MAPHMAGVQASLNAIRYVSKYADAIAANTVRVHHIRYFVIQGKTIGNESQHPLSEKLLDFSSNICASSWAVFSVVSLVMAMVDMMLGLAVLLIADYYLRRQHKPVLAQKFKTETRQNNGCPHHHHHHR
jgi:hypothetical protein